MFQSLVFRLIGDTDQIRITKCRDECEFVDGISHIPKAVRFRVVSVNIRSCYIEERLSTIIVQNLKKA